MERAISPMIVDLPDPEDPTRAVDRPRLGDEVNSVEYGLSGLILELHVAKFHSPGDRPDATVRLGSWSSGFSLYLRDRIHSREGLGDLCTDLHDLKYRSNQERQDAVNVTKSPSVIAPS